MKNRNSKLDTRKKYLQIALNSTLEEAKKIISRLPKSERIILEAGTPLIKRYGETGIWQIKKWYGKHLGYYRFGGSPLVNIDITSSFNTAYAEGGNSSGLYPYVVADMKMMDRGATEAEIAHRAGADAVIALGSAPSESLNAFIQACEDLGMDSMIDMMNVEYPLAVLRSLKKQPTVVIVHRGVDEETFNKEKQIPLHEIRRIKSNYNSLISVAGGDTVREVQRAMFNDADIVIVWKYFYQSTDDTVNIAEQFLKEIK